MKMNRGLLNTLMLPLFFILNMVEISLKCSKTPFIRMKLLQMSLVTVFLLLWTESFFPSYSPFTPNLCVEVLTSKGLYQEVRPLVGLVLLTDIKALIKRDSRELVHHFHHMSLPARRCQSVKQKVGCHQTPNVPVSYLRIVRNKCLFL